MNNEEKSKSQRARNQELESKKVNLSQNTKKKKDKSLPWWVELLFVQIGLPDKFLIKILKFKKNTKELLNNEKKLVFTFLFLMTALAYFYPVVKYTKNKLGCEEVARSYIIKNKNIIELDKRELRMLSTNFCHGGEEINEIKK